ncbi:MAG: DUF3352 domain-containing protein [Trueperaceae bacterium]|nr:DUF3352 domain-containing protein [Trueperaceae bacterium]
MIKRYLVRTLLVTVLVGGLAGGLASAQNMAPLLPDNTILALGMQDLTGLSEQSEAFRDEFQRLGLGEALLAASGGSAEEIPDNLGELEPRLEGVTILDLIGQEAWIAVSASSFNPIPSATLATALPSELTGTVSELLAESVESLDARELEESGYTFYQVAIPEPDFPFPGVVYSLADNILVLSTDPETIRGYLRRAAGENGTSLVDTAAYGDTLGSFDAGNFYGYLDVSRVASTVRPFASGFGFDEAVAQLTGLLETVNVSTGVIRVTDSGIVSESALVPSAAGNSDLYTLLTQDATADLGSASFAPTGVLSYTAGSVDLVGWWDYLNSVAQSVPQLGTSLDQLVLSTLGVDLRNVLFDWTTGDFASITTGVAAPAQPGMPSDNLLGEVAYLLGASDETAASEGLGQLFQTASQTAAMFGSASGSGEATMETENIGDVTVTTYEIMEGLSLSYAVTDGYAIIATSADVARTVVEANSGSNNFVGSDAYNEMTDYAPDGASALAYSDTSALTEGTAESLLSQLQLASGLGSASGVNPQALEDAAEPLNEFFSFVADRVGSTYGYSERRDDGITYSRSEISVSW